MIRIRKSAVLTCDYCDFGASLRGPSCTGPVPFLARRLGYLPCARMGLGADLPLDVYEDRRRWCLSPGMHLSDVGRRLPVPDSRLVTAEMRIVAMSDDDWVPIGAVWRVMALHPEAMKRQLVLWPEAFGLRRIGHLGALHRRNAVVWPALVD